MKKRILPLAVFIGQALAGRADPPATNSQTGPLIWFPVASAQAPAKSSPGRLALSAPAASSRAAGLTNQPKAEDWSIPVLRPTFPAQVAGELTQHWENGIAKPRLGPGTENPETLTGPPRLQLLTAPSQSAGRAAAPPSEPAIPKKKAP